MMYDGTTAFLSLALIYYVSGQQCPNLTNHEIDLSPLQGAWDTLFYSQTEGSLVANIPHFFNISLCGPLPNSACGDSSSVCYSSSLEESGFYNLGTNNSRQVAYGDRRVTFTYAFSADDKVKNRYGTGNVSITLICGRTLGVPEVILGNPNSDQILMIWETSAACKTSSSRHYSRESKCYHVHVYEDNGLRASFIDLTSLIRPEGYLVESDNGSKIRLSVCKPLMLRSNATARDDFPLACNGTMGCLPTVGSGALVLGEWSDGEDSRLHVHNGLLTVEYSANESSDACFSDSTITHTRSIRIHFICPTENQDLGTHVTYHDSSHCLVIISWYTSFACGKAAIQSFGCTLSTQGGQVFDLNGLSTQDDIVAASSTGQSYVYSLHICQGSRHFEHCDPRPPDDTHVVQLDGNICHSLGSGSGVLRYVDGTLSLTYSRGETCHSNFARTSLITFLCPADLEEGRANTTAVTYLGKEDCFYEFEWVTPLACGSKSSGTGSCKFELPEVGLYNFAPLVGTEDYNFVAVSGDASYICFMINPCGKLVITSETTLRSGTDYCNSRIAPRKCSGASVCAIFASGDALPIGLFDLGKASSVASVDQHVVAVSGRMKSNNYSATIHYVCKPGDLSSAPVFVGVVDQLNYEFHWNTYAACPSGQRSGSDCTVSFQSYLFNLTSLPDLRFDSPDGVYSYEISVCSSLRPNSTCGGTRKTAACQITRADKKPYILGQANSTLVYNDGTLKLTYRNGSLCHHLSIHRSTTLLFICDSNAHTPSVTSVTEDLCTYVVEVRTKLACPPAYRATECVYLHNGLTYDFSVLSRSQDQGNWQTRGPDGSEYLINVCQPLNRVSGCSPLAGACRIGLRDGHVTYTNLGLAYNTTFHQHGNHVRLVYEYPSKSQRCPKVYTTLVLMCSNQTSNSEAGPHYVSGGEVQDSCEYTFTWETIGACPVKPITKNNACQLSTPTNFTFDLTPLANTSDNRGYYQIGPADSSAFTFNLSMCSPLKNCNNKSNVAVCQEDSTHKSHVCGLSTNQNLSYFDGALFLRFGGGDICKHNNKRREVLITFECDRLANVSDTRPKYLNESECAYTFSWATPLACLPQELDCVAAGGKYDLTPLLQHRHWTVDTGAVGGDYSYVIGGCRSLDYLKLPQCPQVPWMGGCRYNGTGSGSRGGPVGSVLGFVTGDIVEEDEGVLRLEYHNGDTCAGGGKSLVHIHFTCGPGTREGVPTLDAASNNCHTHINWVTQYACSRITNTSSSSSRWVLKDPVTSNVINLTSLPSNLTINYMDENDVGVSYDYTVSLHGGSITCNSAAADMYNGAPGACQVKRTGGCNSTQPKCVRTLGYLADNSSSLSLTDGTVRAEYRNGDACHHVAAVLRKAVIIFMCDMRAPFLEVMPENMCEYTFIVHTNLTCVKATPIGVECQVKGFHDLVAFQRLSGVMVLTMDQDQMFVSVCDPLAPGVGGCLPGAAVCLHSSNGEYVNLGVPSPHYPPRPLAEEKGVMLHYVQGDVCTGDMRWKTNLLLVCNEDIPVGVPELVSKESCTYTLRWESISACPTELPVSENTASVCSIQDLYGTEKNLIFKPFLRNLDLITPDNHGGRYAIQLCGSGSPRLPPPTCDEDTGVCWLQSSGANKTLVYAKHFFTIVSRSPRVIDVTFLSGTSCHMNPEQNWSAVVHMVCSDNKETILPKLVSDEDCELHFDWRNQSFCEGKSASRGCTAIDDTTGYIYSLDAMLAQEWMGLVFSSRSGLSSGGGTFSLGICRNLNPFSSSGLNCSSPSAVCWHTPDNRHINLGRSSSKPEVVVGHAGYKSIHIRYSNGDVCNSSSKEQYHTDLYLHCAKESTEHSSTPILSLHDDVGGGNCSWLISMNSALACQYELASNSCHIETSSGTFNFNDLAQQPLNFSAGSHNYSLCICGSSHTCKYSGLVNVTGGKTVKLGAFRRLSVSTSTGGPLLAYYKGDLCTTGGNTRFQSWLLMECSRNMASGSPHTLIESETSSACNKVFLWYTPLACRSREVACSFRAPGSQVFYDFSLLHSQGRPWRVPGDGGDIYYINICGAIVSLSEDGLESCGEDVAVCRKSSDGKLTAIALANTQQITNQNQAVSITFTGVSSDKCPEKKRFSVFISMTCDLNDFKFKGEHDCEYRFLWKTPLACKESIGLKVYQSCEAVPSTSPTGGFVFYPSKIPPSQWVDSTRGTFYVNLCAQSKACRSGVSVCMKMPQETTTTDIATYTNTSILRDEYQMLVQMNGKSTHAVIRVICYLPSDDAHVHEIKSTLVLDNIVNSSNHVYYYFSLFAKQGRGCQFTNPTTASSSPSAIPPSKSGSSRSGRTATVVVVIILMAALVSAVIVLMAVFYKKNHRDKLVKAFVQLTMGKSDEPVRYHKLTHQEEEHSLMGDRSSSGSGSDEIPLEIRGENQLRPDDDEELINL